MRPEGGFLNERVQKMLGTHGCFHFSVGAAELTVLMHSGLQVEESEL